MSNLKLKQQNMKNLLLALTLLFTITTFSQEENSKPSYYLAAGLSTTNSDDFSDASYFSVEAGIMIDNVAFGAVFGRNNLTNTFNNDSFNNYWCEGKVAVYRSLGLVDGYGVLGIGSYIGNGNLFLEYGLGISKKFENFGLFIQVSNWDGVNYITPGISVSL